MPALKRVFRLKPVALLLAAGLTIFISTLTLGSSDYKLDYQPVAYAIKGAKVVVAPGRTIDVGTIVVRKGIIEAVGPADKVAVPYDAELIDGKGMVVYSGFVDMYTTLGQAVGVTRSQVGAGRTVKYSDFAFPRTPPDNRLGITPEFEVASVLDLPDATADERRRLGFTDLVAAPAGAIATGQSAFSSLSGLPRREAIVKAPLALHIHVAAPSEPTPPPDPNEAPAVSMRRFRGTGATGYPSALMGVVAHLRQAMLDSEHAHVLDAFYEEKGGPRPPFDPSLKALHAARTKTLPVWWEANTGDEIHRALDLADEFGTSAVIVGGRDSAKVAGRLKQKGVPVVLKLDFAAEEPRVPTESEYRARPDAERDEPLRVLADRSAKWKERAGTAAALAKAGVPFAFATDGVAQISTFPAQVRKAIAAGLSKDAALDALTQSPARIAGLEKRLGTLEVGKLGHVVVMTAPFDEERAKVRYILADGIKFDMEKQQPPSKGADAKGKGAFGKGRGAAGKDSARKPTTDDEPDTAEKKEAEKKEDAPTKPEPTKGEMAKKGEPSKKTETAKKDDASKKVDTPKTPFVDVASELEADRKPTIKTGGSVFIKDAVILTVTKGTIPRGSILIKDGKIAAIGADLKAPEGVTVIDAGGLVAMPGIIDTHSHMAISGGVNEMSLSVVPEVRVKDVISGDDDGVYRALAGGTTTNRLLHGSANTIGGQDAVIKLKHGVPGREMIIRDGPQGVKFALGENVTRRQGRFPNTRMGVEAVIERSFDEARAYKTEWEQYGAAKARGAAIPPPRRDLRLEALAGILDGSIKIHSHCYRNDEILMLLRTATKYGVRVQSLQHVLEGYKVAAEIAAHGASASTFSDWWAYKIEAYDAIPFNAALLTQAGASVCIKSDSEELVRHLYLEAAKMVKYGGVPEPIALAMITINPARELGLDHRLGSIEVGKDGDIALFNAHPFDGFTRCELSLIDGEVWFQRRTADGKLAKPRAGDHSSIAVSPARTKPIDLAVEPSGRYAIQGATLHPVTGPDIQDGTIVVEAGRIVALGGPKTTVPAGVKVIDAKGLDVWPGLVDAGSPLGLFEIGSLQETQDSSDSAQYQPELRTSTALHPDSELIPVTRANGVLATFVQPGGQQGGVISGQGCVIEHDGWVPSDMVVLDRAALLVTIPRYVTPNPEGNRRRPGGFGAGGDGGDPNARRKEVLEGIKDQFHNALDYDKVRAAAIAHNAPAPTPDPRLAALVPYAKGEKPVIFRADRRIEILDAIALAKDLKLKGIITGGADAWKVAPALKAANMPVLVCGTLYVPGSATEPYDAPYANPAKLHEAGVTFAIRSGPPGSDQGTAPRNLPYEAATAVAFGLPEAEALRSVTITPAKLLGVDSQLGSLDVGKRANLVITAGHILQPTTEVRGLFISGKPMTPESSHTRLYSKFQRRLGEIKAGAAKLGIDVVDPSSKEPVKPVTPPAAGGEGAGLGGQP
jgi:imidazolonepropionase-like amidohydrolase